MTASVTHPLVASWLRDLDQLLDGVDPADRAEVLAGVREHLDASLPSGASDDEVRRALAELGPPQAVADEAYAGRPAFVRPPAPAVVTSPSRGTLTQRWVPVMVGVFLSFALVPMLVVAARVVVLAFQVVPSPDGGPPMSSPLTPQPAALLMPLLTALLFTLPFAAALSVPSGLWTGAEKIRIVLLAPAVVLVLAFAPRIGELVSGSIVGTSLAAALAIIASIAGALVVLADLRAGSRRAIRHRGEPARVSGRWASWTGYAACAVNALCLLPLLVPGYALMGNLSGVFTAIAFFALPWVAVCLLSATTTAWTRGEMLTSIMLLPVAVGCLAAMAISMSWAVGTGPALLLASVLVVGTALWVITRLVRALQRP